MSQDSRTGDAEPRAGEEDKAHADVGIVAALPMELAPFLDRCERVRKYTGGNFVFRGGIYDGVRIAVGECRGGFANARRVTEALIDAHTPDWVLSCGFSGGLLPEMKVGHIVVPEEIVDIHGQQYHIDLKMPADPARGLFGGRIVTVDEIVRKVDDKRALAEQYGAVAADLESLSVAKVCAERKQRFLAVRVISDDLSQDLPSEILSIYGNTGTVRVGAALGAVWKRPSSVKDMWKLRNDAKRAAERLADFLDGVVKQLTGM